MRILLKISGESLKWEKDFWIDPDYVENISKIIEEIKNNNHELAIVVWWGNIYRWGNLIKTWVNPSDSHSLSMLSTVFNWVVLKNFLDKIWLKSIVMSPLWINFIEQYSRNKADILLKKGHVVIFAWWTGNPFFTTDSWWVLRSIELGMELMIKATRVDWVYTKDPEEYSTAKFIKKITYQEIINKDLKVMDQTAIILAKENNLNLKVVNINNQWSIIEAINWWEVWTIITN
jgi:uridylate kinase